MEIFVIIGKVRGINQEEEASNRMMHIADLIKADKKTKQKYSNVLLLTEYSHLRDRRTKRERKRGTTKKTIRNHCEFGTYTHTHTISWTQIFSPSIY